MNCEIWLREFIIILASALLFFSGWMLTEVEYDEPTKTKSIVEEFDWSVFSSQRDDEESELFLHIPHSTVQMRDLLEFGYSHELSSNPRIFSSGGKQRDKLQIFFVPHSHNDAGWLSTFDDYYESQTRHILTNIVSSLCENPSLRFIWAEVSFLSLFWDDADNDTRENLRSVIANGQLEIVTGGWVMNDEANPHYFAMIQQLVDGHLWLYDRFRYRPRNSWAIDPFGHSPTMPYLLRKMGFENLLINRIHYQIKDYFSKTKNLEFFWRQAWDVTHKSDVFTAVLPFHYHLGLQSVNGIVFSASGEEYGKQVIAFLANHWQYVLDSNILLIPVGSDFSYANENEATRMFAKCSELIDFVNVRFSSSAVAKFGTLNDYFEAQRATQPREVYRNISGDFFTYSDDHETYWSGYYTSRPFYKRKDRVLLSYLRAAEILYALAWSSERNRLGSQWFISEESTLFDRLTRARRNVSLFQHHDAISGTSRKHVVLDYSNRLDDALKQLKYIIQESMYFLLRKNLPHLFSGGGVSDMNGDISAMPRIYFDMDSSYLKRVRVFNSLTWKRREIVSVMTNTPHVKVLSRDGSSLLSQTGPAVAQNYGRNVYSVSFFVEINGLSINTYYIQLVQTTEENKSNFLSQVTFLNTFSDAANEHEKIKTHKYSKKFSLSNAFMKVDFNEHGLVRYLSLGNSSSLSLSIDFIVYDAVNSGAYVFKPTKDATMLPRNSSSVRLITGPIYSQVDTTFISITHSLRIYHSPDDFSCALEIKNLVNLQSENNCEVAMRISSEIKSGDEFFTDLNGLQMARRRRLDVFGIAGNYYPMSTAAYIEDGAHRLTVMSGQPGGFASLQEGQMDVMLDRRSQYDDYKGLEQGIMDNVPYINVLSMILERRKAKCRYIHKDHSAGILSQYGTLLSHSILHPLLLATSSKEKRNTATQFSALSHDLGNDVHLVKVHTFFRDGHPKAGVILHRMAINKCYPLERRPFLSTNGSINLSNLFPKYFDSRIARSSLSFTYIGEHIALENEYIGPMDMKAYLMSLQSI